MLEMQVYTDGAASPNPGYAGWGVVFEDGESYHGSFEHATNNLMELYAILSAIMLVPDECTSLDIHTDSQCALNWLAHRWPGNDTTRYWVGLYHRTVQEKRLKVRFTRVRGHTGHPGNEAAHLEAQRGVHYANPQHCTRDWLALSRHNAHVRP